MFLVAGGLVLATAIIAGLVFVHRKIGPRIPISSPLVSTIESKKCHVLVDFERAHNLKGMGRVVGIEGVKVNNTKRILTVTYLEKPAIRSSRGWEMFKWLKHRLSFGKSLVRRVETLAFPESCMAASHSSFQVAEANGHVSRMLVDLDLNPGPLTVPREILENNEIDELLSRYEQDSQWKLYEDCVMHITVDRPFEGSPLVQVEPARGRVSFQNPELHHLSSELPRNCDWREPSRLRIIYKSHAGAPLDVLLMMTAADPPLEESVNLDRGYGEATLQEDSDDVLSRRSTCYATLFRHIEKPCEHHEFEEVCNDEEQTVDTPCIDTRLAEIEFACPEHIEEEHCVNVPAYEMGTCTTVVQESEEYPCPKREPRIRCKNVRGERIGTCFKPETTRVPYTCYETDYKEQCVQLATTEAPPQKVKPAKK
uniref:Uncharacterized protein n=1 Tax=Eimeria tenella TaxID=5802 RepID=A5JNZ1_EIMTE|nr:unknown [Eimeria tenella]